jgi:hypothetical protein
MALDGPRDNPKVEALLPTLLDEAKIVTGLATNQSTRREPGRAECH